MIPRKRVVQQDAIAQKDRVRVVAPRSLYRGREADVLHRGEGALEGWLQLLIDGERRPEPMLYRADEVEPA